MGTTVALAGTTLCQQQGPCVSPEPLQKHPNTTLLKPPTHAPWPVGTRTLSKTGARRHAQGPCQGH